MAEACQAIPPPTDMSLVAEDFKNEGTPSVDDIHTKIAKKLQVRNAIVDASGRVGAAQVCSLNAVEASDLLAYCLVYAYFKNHDRQCFLVCQ